MNDSSRSIIKIISIANIIQDVKITEAVEIIQIEKITDSKKAVIKSASCVQDTMFGDPR